MAKLPIEAPDSTPSGTYDLTTDLARVVNGRTFTLTANPGVDADDNTRYKIGTIVIADAPVNAVYVSPSGNDTNNGAIGTPVLTLTKARDLARALVVAGTGSVNIYLRAGEYRLTAALDLDKTDSGVTWQAYQNEVATITGDIAVTGSWTSIGGGVYSLSVPGGTWFQELFVDGVRMTRSRLPATGWWIADVTSSKSVFTASTSSIGSYSDAAQAWAVIRSYEWSEERLPVSAINSGTKQVTLEKDAVYSIRESGQPGAFALENLQSGIVAEGQWCLNAATNTLYLYPPTGTNLGTATIRGGKQIALVNLVGDGENGPWVENVTFRNIRFARSGARELSVSEGGDYTSHAIRCVQGTRKIVFDNCTFTDMGSGAIFLSDECHECSVINSQFIAIGESAIEIVGEPGKRTTGAYPWKNNGHTVRNNRIQNVGRNRGVSYGVRVAMSNGCIIERNFIADVGYAGIRLAGQLWQNWDTANSPGVTSPDTLNIKPFIATGNCIVRRNRIERTCNQLSDGGAIYCWGVMGTERNHIVENLIVTVGTTQSYSTIGADIGIYFDDEADNIYCYDNTVIDANWGVTFHASSDIDYSSNVHIKCRTYWGNIQPETYGRNSSVLVRNNVFEATGAGVSWFTAWGSTPPANMTVPSGNKYVRAGAPISDEPNR